MKHWYLTLIIAVLPGCSFWVKHVPVVQPFPPAIKSLTEPCPDLQEIKGDSVAVSELLKAVVNNYTLYYQCSLKNDGWNEWYVEQKKIYEEVRSKGK